MSKIYFRYGAMNCGKTTALLQVAHNYEENGKKVIIIKSIVDKKGGDTIVSRLGISRKVDLLLPEDKTIKKSISLEGLDCILVDEVQFLTQEQVRELWLISKLKNIPVICYGLKTNFIGELFRGSKAVIEVADEIEEIATICSCGKKARYNARLVNGKYVTKGDAFAIDTIDASYEPLCPECYINKILGIAEY